MSEGDFHFLSMMAVSFLVVALSLELLMLRRAVRPPWPRVAGVAMVVVAGGMAWGRLGAHAGLPWGVYLLPPVAATLLLPPLAFRLSRRETVSWLAVAVASGPLVHVAFSLLLGWGEFIPPWHLPTLAEWTG